MIKRKKTKMSESGKPWRLEFRWQKMMKKKRMKRTENGAKENDGKMARKKERKKERKKNVRKSGKPALEAGENDAKE